MSRKTRKLIWSAPLVAVLAVAAALAIFAVQAPSNAAAQDDTAASITVPGPSLGLDVEALSQYSIRLSWTVPTGDAPTYYRIDQSSDKAVWKRLVERVDVSEVEMRGTDADGNPRVGHVIEKGITPETQRYYRVYAGNAAGDGPQSNEPATVYINVGESFPATPLGTFTLSGSSNSPTKVNLSWTSAPNPRGAEIDGYRVVQMVYPTGFAAGTNPRQECPAAGEYNDGTTAADLSCLYIAADDQGTGLTAMHTGLTARKTYHYQVIAQVDDTDAARSNIVVVVTAGANDPTRPRYPVAVPVGADVDNAATGTVNLYWVEPTDTGGLNLVNPDIQYQVKIGSAPWPQGVNAWLDLGDANLVPGAMADAAQFTTDAGLTAPAITDLNNIDQGVVTSPENATVEVTNTAGTTVQYRFRMRSKQETTDNTSDWVLFSNSRDGVEMQPDIADDIPNEPAEFKGEPLSGSTENEVGIRLTWNVPDRDDDDDGTIDRPPGGDYRIDWSLDGLKWQRAQVDTLRIREWKDIAAKADETRYYRIFSKNSNHFSLAADGGMTAGSLQDSVAASDALAFTAEGISSTQIKLTWNDLDGAGCYNLFEAGVHTATGVPNDHDSDSTIWDQIDLDDAINNIQGTAGTTHTHGGLTKGEQRWYRIDTYTTEDNGNCITIISDASGITVLGQTKDEVGRLAEPLNLVAEVAKDSSGEDDSARGVLLQWLKPLEADGFDDPEGYAIQVSTDGGLNWDHVTGNTGSIDTIYRHPSPLMSDEQRIYRVRSASSDTAILSDWSNESHYPPMTATPQPPAFSAPSGVDAMSANGVVTISWTPGDSAMSQVVIAVNAADDTDFCLAVKAGDASSHTCDKALTVGTSYVLLVIALDGQGNYMLGNIAPHPVQ